MEKHTLEGKELVVCLRFLTAYKRSLDDEGIPEGAEPRIWTSFLKKSAYDAFMQSQDELMTEFMQVMPADIRPILRRALNSHKTPTRLRMFTEEELAIYLAHKALSKPEKKLCVLSVEGDPPERRYYSKKFQE
eukprot:IDg12856t1